MTGESAGGDDAAPAHVRLPPRTVKEYTRQLLEALYQRYGKGRRSGFNRFAPALTMQIISEWGLRDDGTVELPLWETLRSAQMMPEQVNFEGLLAEVEEAISQVPESEQLRLAGEALLRMAEVYAARAETWMEEWEQASRDPMRFTCLH